MTIAGTIKASVAVRISRISVEITPPITAKQTVVR